MSLYALKTAAAVQDERLVALIHQCRELATEIGKTDVTRAAHALNAILDLQLARPESATSWADREKLARARA